MSPDPWKCAECGVHYPIQPMARECEANDKAIRVRDGFDRINAAFRPTEEKRP